MGMGRLPVAGILIVFFYRGLFSLVILLFLLRLLLSDLICNLYFFHQVLLFVLCHRLSLAALFPAGDCIICAFLYLVDLILHLFCLILGAVYNILSRFAEIIVLFLLLMILGILFGFDGHGSFFIMRRVPGAGPAFIRIAVLLPDDGPFAVFMSQRCDFRLRRQDLPAYRAL